MPCQEIFFNSKKKLDAFQLISIHKAERFIEEKGVIGTDGGRTEYQCGSFWSETERRRER